MRQFLVVVETVLVVPQAQRFVPFQTELFPVTEPIHFRAGLDEELHFHLLELTHTEDELTRYNLVTESLAYLCDAERQFHASGLLHVQVVDKNTLCRLRTKVDTHGTIGGGTHLGGEHQVELAHIGPVACAADGANNFFVKDDLLQFVQVHLVHGVTIALMQSVEMCLVLQYAGVGGAELRLVESVAKTLARFLHLLVDFLLNLCQLFLNEHVGTITFLRVAVIYQRVVESVHVSRCFPHRRVHEDSGIYAHDVLVQEGHRVPPITLDVVLQFHTILAVVVHRRQTVINLR